MIDELWCCGDCGKQSPRNDGKIFIDSQYHTSFSCDICLNKKIYKIEITFSTDKDLNADQLANLENALLLQIEEPTDYDQNAEDYETSQINYKMEEVK
jgi:hypothetical protein